MTSQLPIVAILATGGTIAGLLDSHSTDYKAGVLDIDSLIQALPQLQNIQKKINLHTEQIANIDSATATLFNVAFIPVLYERLGVCMLKARYSGAILQIKKLTSNEESNLFCLSIEVVRS